MKLVVLVAVLLVASQAPGAQAGFWSTVGDFFSNLGNAALDVLKDTGESLLKNATSTTVNMLKETGQMALFELGNTMNNNHQQKRDISQLVQKLTQLQKEFDVILERAMGHAQEDFKKVVTGGQQIVASLLSGLIEPQAALNMTHEMEAAVQRVTDQLKSTLFNNILVLLNRHFEDNGHKGDLTALNQLYNELTHFLQPFLNLVHKELGTVTQAVQTLAHSLLNHADQDTTLSNLRAIVH